MNGVLLRAGQSIGLLGMLLMAIAVVARLAGRFVLGGVATSSLMLAGIAAVGVGCFLLLWLLTERLRQ
jgi:hypothetical protein